MSGILKLYYTSQAPGKLGKSVDSGPALRDSDSVGLGWGPKFPLKKHPQSSGARDLNPHLDSAM